jgi:hypothetical protein
MTLHRMNTPVGSASASGVECAPRTHADRRASPDALELYATAPAWVDYADHCVCTLWHPLGRDSEPYNEAARRLASKGFTVLPRTGPPPLSTYHARAGLLPRGRR